MGREIIMQKLSSVEGCQVSLTKDSMSVYIRRKMVVKLILLNLRNGMLRQKMLREKEI
jgi:hypothetical protein